MLNRRSQRKRAKRDGGERAKEKERKRELERNREKERARES